MTNRAFLYVLANVSLASVPFILTPIFTHMLDPASFGLVVVFQMILNAFGVLIGLSTSGAALRFNYDKNCNENSLSSYIVSVLFIGVCSSIVLLACFLLFAEAISIFFNVDLISIYCALFISMLLFITKVRLGQWQAQNNAAKYALIQILQSILILVLTISYLYLIDASYLSRIYAHVIAAIVVALLSLYFLIKDRYFIEFRVNKSYLKDAIKQGVGIIPHAIGIYLIFSIDRWVIADKLGSAELGVYMIAVQISLVLNLLYDAYNKSFAPKLFSVLSKGSREDRKGVVKSTYKYILVVIVLSLVLMLAAPYLIEIISPEEYYSSKDYVKYIILAQMMNGVYFAFINYIIYSKKLYIISAISISITVFYALVCSFAVQNYGLEGAAVSFMLVMGIRTILTAIYALKEIKMPWLKIN